MSQPSTQPASEQKDFDKITQLVNAQFQVHEAILQEGIPTYILTWPQETKQPFLRLLESLKPENMIASMRKEDGKIVLKVMPKPVVKPSNPLINIAFLIATIVTTFIAGYFLLPPEAGINPFLSGAIFSASILLVLGIHEMGHKITANRKKIDASAPYFIPGPPPLGTFGAVITQKSLPANRDDLFDIGANGPIAGFVIAFIFSVVGITLSIPGVMPTDGTSTPLPISWILLIQGLSGTGLVPTPIAPNNGLFMHPIALAGWAGMVVTMLNLLPAAMLDGGHVARSLVSGKARFVLTVLSVALLLFSGMFIVMAFLVIFMSFFKHPGPLDDVSGLSKNRKLLTVMLVAFFVLSFPINFA